ncbi:MAG: hypothetical protein KDH96_10680, partial [Candidatus Riesia sp.]|nr:hypothetical protein [Candidatus Riesia sp.]
MNKQNNKNFFEVYNTYANAAKANNKFVMGYLDKSLVVNPDTSKLDQLNQPLYYSARATMSHASIFKNDLFIIAKSTLMYIITKMSIFCRSDDYASAFVRMLSKGMMRKCNSRMNINIFNGNFTTLTYNFNLCFYDPKSPDRKMFISFFDQNKFKESDEYYHELLRQKNEGKINPGDDFIFIDIIKDLKSKKCITFNIKCSNELHDMSVPVRIPEIAQQKAENTVMAIINLINNICAKIKASAPPVFNNYNMYKNILITELMNSGVVVDKNVKWVVKDDVNMMYYMYNFPFVLNNIISLMIDTKTLPANNDQSSFSRSYFYNRNMLQSLSVNNNLFPVRVEFIVTPI